jgi:hypothetical protein
LLRDFEDVVLIDGSRLDKIAHRLKILHPEKAAVLPGCLLAVYDLFRGIATQLWFDPDAGASEFNRATEAIECLAPNTLVVGDRLYSVPEIFRYLESNHCFGVFRRNRSVGIRKVKRLSSSRPSDGGLCEDWLVEAGSGKGALTLRLIVYTVNGKTQEALTNVLDPRRLCAEDVIRLYPKRWAVEIFQAHCICKENPLKLWRRSADNPVVGARGPCSSRGDARASASHDWRGVYKMYQRSQTWPPPACATGRRSLVRGLYGLKCRQPGNIACYRC